MSAPTGTVTLVFTDVESSCAMWEAHPGEMHEALLVHDALMRRLLGEHDGYEVKTEGDAFMISFRSAGDAIAFCVDVQASLRDLEWPPALAAQGGLRVRMGAHQGDPHCEPNPVTGRMDYLGPMVNRAARIAGLARGGQILCCDDTVRAAGAVGGARRIEHGRHRLKGLAHAVSVVEIAPAWRPETLGAPRSQAPTEAPSRAGADRDAADLLPRAAEALLARGRVRALRGDAAARDDLRLARELAAASSRGDLRRRAELALLGFEVDRESRDARGDLEALREDARRAEDTHVEARATIALARLRIARMERLDEVRAELDGAASHAERIADPDLQAAALLYLGLLERRTSQFERAHDTLGRALALTEGTGSRRHLGPILNGLGSVNSVLGIADDALAVRAQEEARRTGSVVDETWATLYRGSCALFAGDPAAGLGYLTQARAAFEALGFEAGAWRTSLMIGIAQAALGRYAEADATMAAAATSDPGQNASNLTAGALRFHRAWVYLAASREHAARSDARSALDSFGALPEHPLRRQCERLLDVLDGAPAPAAPDLTASLLRALGATRSPCGGATRPPAPA